MERDPIVPTSFAATCRVACNDGESILDAEAMCEAPDANPIDGSESDPESMEPEPPIGEENNDDEDGADNERDGLAPERDGECTLQFRAEARDSSGPCISCRSGDPITLYAVVENPCNRALSYRSERSCLASEFSVLNLASRSSSVYPMTCRVVERRNEIEPGATLTQSRPAGRLSPNQYELSIQFEDMGRTTRVSAFTVE